MRPALVFPPPMQHNFPGQHVPEEIADQFSLSHYTVVGPERQKSCLIRQNIRMHFLCHRQARPHSGVCRYIPIGIVGKGGRILCDSQFLRPERQLFGVGAGCISSGNEGILPVSNSGKSVLNRFTALHTCRIIGRPAQYKVVIKEGEPLRGKSIQDIRITCVYKGSLLGFRMD